MWPFTAKFQPLDDMHSVLFVGTVSPGVHDDVWRNLRLLLRLSDDFANQSFESVMK